MFPFNTRIQRIHTALDDLIAIYDSVGRKRGWVVKARRARKTEDETDLCQMVRSWIGGMGSILDDVLSQQNGDQGTPQDLERKQARMDQVIGRLIKLSRC